MGNLPTGDNQETGICAGARRGLPVTVRLT